MSNMSHLVEVLEWLIGQGGDPHWLLTISHDKNLANS